MRAIGGVISSKRNATHSAVARCVNPGLDQIEFLVQRPLFILSKSRGARHRAEALDRADLGVDWVFTALAPASVKAHWARERKHLGLFAQFHVFPQGEASN